MTTKTDFHAIQELREKYTPKVRGIVSRGLPPRKVSHGERGIHGKDTKPGAGTAGR